MERRQFFYLAGLGTSTLLAGNILTSCSKEDDNPDPNNPGTGNPGSSKKITIDLNDPVNAALAAPGGSAIKDNVIILHTTGNNYFALSKVCTHQSCTVGFDGTEVVCPCHGSRFSTSGAVLQGPAASPLSKYTASVSDNILSVTL